MEKCIVILILFLLLPPEIPSKPSLKCFEPVETNDCKGNNCRKLNNKNSTQTNDTTHVRVVRCSEMYNALGKVIKNLAKGRAATPQPPQVNHMKILANLMGLGRAKKPKSNMAYWTFTTRRPSKLLGRSVPKVYNSEGEEEDFDDLAEGAEWQLDHEPEPKVESTSSEGLLTRLFTPVKIFMTPIIEELVEENGA